MLYRRNTSDAAIGWISTVDSLLLGFGLMVVLSLHTAMKRRDVQAIADRASQALETQTKSLADSRMRERAFQQKIEAIQADAAVKTSALTADLKDMTRRQDELVVHSRGLQEQLDAAAHGVEGISNKLREAILDRDSLKQQKSELEKQLVTASRGLEAAKRQLAEATTAVSRARDERDELEIKVNETQGRLLLMENQQKKVEENGRALIQEVDSLRGKVADKSREVDNLTLTLESRERDLNKLKSDAAKAANAMDIAVNRIETAARAKGQAAATEVLGFQGQFRNVVFIIDVSHSMTHISDPNRPGFENDTYNPQRWNKTKREIVSWARHLPMETLRLVVFHSNVFEYPGGGKFFSMRGAERGEAVGVLEKGLDRVKPTGQTNTLGALEKAYSYPDVDTMILFTDGNPVVEGAKTADLIASVRGLIRQHRNIPVNVVGIGEYFEKSFADFLRDIASVTGGEFIGR
jgi:hypothetical protein